MARVNPVSLFRNGSIVTGLSAPIVASVAEKEPAPVAAPVVTPAPLADMSKFQVSQL